MARQWLGWGTEAAFVRCRTDRRCRREHHRQIDVRAEARLPVLSPGTAGFGMRVRAVGPIVMTAWALQTQMCE